MKKATNYINFLLVILVFFVNSCLSRYEEHGYIFDSIKKEELKVDLSSKNEVFAIMGSPTIKTYEESGDYWLYFSEDIKELLFFKPKAIKRDIFIIKFAKNNKIERFAIYTLNEQREINFDVDSAEVSDFKPGFFKSVVGNIGQVTPQ